MKFRNLLALILAVNIFSFSGLSKAADTEENLLTSESPEAAIMFLGSFQLNNWMQTYTIPIQSCARLHVGLNHLQLRFRNGGALIERLAVRYGNGQVQSLAVRRNFVAGSFTRWIDLGIMGMNDSRCVNALIVRGRALPTGLNPFARTFVTVWGMTGPMNP